MEGVSALDTTAHDWDDPVPARIDPQSIHVDGITHVGGIDIGYRIGSESGEAIAAMVILEYPSMKVSRPIGLSILIHSSNILFSSLSTLHSPISLRICPCGN